MGGDKQECAVNSHLRESKVICPILIDEEKPNKSILLNQRMEKEEKTEFESQVEISQINKKNVL